MEFPFSASKMFQTDMDGVVILDAASLNNRSSYLTSSRLQPYAKYDSNKDLVQILDRMGEASSRAQGLKHVITNYSKFSSSGDNRLYMKVEENKVCGILKVGPRNLFHYDGSGRVKELRPLCVLDFYVHESKQRSGVGKILFEKMLASEKVQPRKLGYDRPSSKLIAFLSKHYGLSKYVPQNNNYVIFNQYWEDSVQPTQQRSILNNPEYSRPIQSNRDSNIINKNISQSEFHRAGRSILESADPSLFAANNRARYSHNSNILAKTMQSPNMPENYTSFVPMRNQEDMQRKSFENNYKRQEMHFDKPPLYNAANLQEPKRFGSVGQAPWGGYDTNFNSFKSSGAYGSHYTQMNFNTWNRR